MCPAVRRRTHILRRMDVETIVRLLEETRSAYSRGDESHIAECDYGDGRWIQIIPFLINLDYPLKGNPKKLVKQLQPPPSVLLESWRRDKFVTFAYDDDNTEGLPDFLLRYIAATGL